MNAADAIVELFARNEGDAEVIREAFELGGELDAAYSEAVAALPEKRTTNLALYRYGLPDGTYEFQATVDWGPETGFCVESPSASGALLKVAEQLRWDAYYRAEQDPPR